MQESASGMVSLPAIDIQYYFNIISTFATSHFPSLAGGVKSLVGLLVGISIPLSLFLLISIVVTVEGTKRIRRKEEIIYDKKVEPAYIDDGKKEQGDAEFGLRWKKVMDRIDSPNENDWRQAIIEADIMLEDLLTKLGYQGVGIGEKLKRVEKGDFKTLQLAWEAHLVRNRIAHDGSSFQLNDLEARRVIQLYREVFEEFYHITG